MAKSPLAPAAFPDLPPVKGVRLGGMHVGIRYKNRKDLMLAELAAGTHVAGVFTRSLTASAPVEQCRRALEHGNGTARLLVVNSGNSNAFTGKRGEESVKATLEACRNLNDCSEDEVFIASTGVIGEPLPHEKITAHLPELYSAIAEDGVKDAAAAILTTDTFPKGSTQQITVDGTPITICGIAKGSGMIAPDMATMLAFIFTDAAIDASSLQAMLERCNERSFNAITVDGDTSTSDTVLLFATGKAGNHPLDAEGAAAFESALQAVLNDLAQQIVRDGEGATKFVTIDVHGAASHEAAKRIGLAIGNSPLVKTAIAGEDPNWGRVVMAVGKAGEKANRDALKIWFGDTLVAADGQRVEGYDEAPVAAYMKGNTITLKVDVGVGDGHATIWTCDLTKRYIEINADYRS